MLFSCFASANANNEEISKLLKKAEQLEKQKEYSSAIEIYTKILKVASEKELEDNSSFIYTRLGLSYYRLKEYKVSKDFFKKSISTSKHSKNMANSYFYLCRVYRKQEDKDSLLWALGKSLEIYNSLDDGYDKSSTYLKGGILLKQNGQYDKAISYLLLAYDGFTKTHHLSKKASTAGHIADIQRLQGNLETSKSYYKKHLELQLQDYDSLKVSFAYNNIANLFYRMERYDSAIVNYHKAFDLQKALGNKINTGKTLSNLGITYQELGDFKNAEKFYKEALELKKQSGDANAIVQTLNELACIEMKNKRFPSSYNYLLESNRFISSTTEQKVLVRNHGIKAKYYSAVGNYKKAHQHQKKYLELYTKVFNDQQSKTIQTLQEQFESKLKEAEISDLTKENELKNTTILLQEKQIQQRNLFLLLFGILILFLIILFLYLRTRHKIKLQQQQLNKFKAVLDGQEIIKTQIAKDLHDIVLNSYEAVRLKIEALLSEKHDNGLKESIVKDIERTNSEVRLISHHLSPIDDIIKDTPLTKVIASRFTEFQHHHHIFIDVNLPLHKVIDRMTLEAKTNLYGIVLQILGNIRKHSKATKVTITHCYDQKKSLQFEFCDNGIGISNHQNKGIGLLNIKQRALLLGGIHRIHSNDQGTCIVIEFPIKQNLPSQRD